MAEVEGRKENKSARKGAYLERVQGNLREYTKAVLVKADNVGSLQMQKIRIALRGKGILVMGKNTMMRKAIRAVAEENPKLEALAELIFGNVGLIFTNGGLDAISAVIEEFRIPAQAKGGAVAPCDVSIDAGVTDLDPGQTTFLQVLGIATKITKTKIEILSDIHLIKKGEKVGASQAMLLQKLNIRPFSYGLEVESVYDNGAVFSSAVLKLTKGDILTQFIAGVQNIAAISLEVGYPTLASVPHSVVNGYKNVLAISVSTEYTFKQAEKVKAYLADPSAFAAAAPKAAPAAASAPAKAAPKAKEPEPEEDAGGMEFSLFD